MTTTKNFYCRKACGEAGFSIEEWNRLFKLAEDMGLSEPEKERILGDRQFALGILCKEQCFDCMAIVGQRRQKTRQINPRDSKS